MLMPGTIHPTSRTLLAYLDGEVPVDERHELARHLRECENCRSELDGIEADLDWHLVLDAASLPSHAPPRADGVQRLLRSMREWRESNGAAVAAAAEKLHREEEGVGEAMEVYFGTDAAGAVAPADKAEALFSAFLGQRAASALMRDVRSRVKMERYLAPDMT